jgi:hypothetical protein
MEIDAFLAGEDESAVEGLVAGLESEDMTPISDEAVDTPKAGKTAPVGKTKSAGRDKPVPAAAEADDAAEAVQGGDAEEIEEEDPFPPGTLGTSS